MTMEEFNALNTNERSRIANAPQWSFCIDPDPDYNEDEEEKKHHQKMIAEAHDSWKLLIDNDYPNEVFPDFLWNPQINDYGDDFAYLNTKTREKTSIFYRAGSLHRVYSDYFDWIDAMTIWYDYMSYVNANYGSFEAFVDGVEAGYFEGVVAAKPKLKKFPGSKDMMRIDVAVSRPSDEEMDWDGVDAEMASLPVVEFTEDDLKDLPRKDKVFPKVDELLIKDQMREWRLNSVLNRGSRGGNYMMDSILDFISNGDSSRVTKQYTGLGASFMDEVNALYDREITNPEMYDEELDKLSRRGIIIDTRTSNYVRAEDQGEQDFIEAMLDAGYNINGILKNSGLKRAAKKMIQRESNERYGDYSPKELKKMRKKQEKESRRRHTQLESDERVQKLLFDNRMSSGELSFTLDEIL